MALTYSTMPPLGQKAPPFSLLSTDGQTVSLPPPGKSRGLLVIFLCNHCPYVKHLNEALAMVTARYLDAGFFVVGICSNDAIGFPEDAPANLRAQKAKFGFRFPYLIDEAQKVARAYDAVCTPDFFLYDGNHRLFYRGQFDDTRPGQGTPTGAALDRAVAALLDGKSPLAEQRPSMGCNIKWK